VQKIEYADLLGFKQRFLTADNATIAVAGNFDRSLAMKALRRYFGGWLKSDKRSPSTFRQPEAPPAAILNVSSPKPGTSEIRFAMRGVARSDKDLPASLVFTKILENRLRARVPAANAGDLFVRNEPHTLPGTIMIGFPASPAAGHKIEANDLLSKALSDPVTETEVQAAKADARAAWASKGQISLWLDADTYQLPNPEADAKPVDMISLSDVKAYAEKLRQMPMAAVLVNTPAKE
jgi:predicted Zn-dependent peptidase